MMVLVSYDVSTTTPAGVRRLHKIAKICVDYGIRVQNSVFECQVEPQQWEVFKSKVFKVFNPEQDSLRFYFMGKNWKKRIEHYGAGPENDPEATLII